MRLKTSILLLLGVALEVSATLVPRMSFEQLVSEASAIVQGRVVGSWASWDSEHRAIWTHTEIAVDDQLKGPAGLKIVISEPGGEVAGTTMQVVGAPQYKLGDEVIVFAARTEIGYSRTCGWGQGKFDIVTVNGSTVVRSAVSRIQLVDAAKTPSVTATPIPRMNGVSVDQFKTRVRSIIDAGPLTRP